MRATHIQYRLRRTTTEDCYVSVPVTNWVMDFDESGAHRLNVEKVVAAALAIGEVAGTWTVEASDIAPHPLQVPRPESADLVSGWPDGHGGYVRDDRTGPSHTTREEGC